jgi:CBS domain-containing protein
MKCPYCNYPNIEGARNCENCRQALSDLDQPKPGSHLEAGIMKSPISKLGPKSPVIVPENTTVAEAIAKLRELHIGCVLVGTVEKVTGIFTERNALLKIKEKYEDAADQPVSKYMTKGIEQLDIETPIAYALNLMSTGNIRHLPVTHKGLLKGIISLRDVLRFMSDYYPDLIVNEA